MTDESSQNSVTSEKSKAPNGAATNGDHKKEQADSDDENYEIQEFDEPEEPVVVIEDDDDEAPEDGSQDGGEGKVKTEDEDVEMKDVRMCR